MLKQLLYLHLDLTITFFNEKRKNSSFTLIVLPKTISLDVDPTALVAMSR